MDDRELDRFLEESIANYGAAEPLTGLPERVIARIGLARAPHRRQIWQRAAIAAALMGLALGAWNFLGRTHYERPLPRKVAFEASAARIPPAPARAVILLTPRPPRHRATALPKRAVFPTPSPLTVEERLLLAMVDQHAEETAGAFESLRKRNEPIEIAPIIVKPLESSGGQ